MIKDARSEVVVVKWQATAAAAVYQASLAGPRGSAAKRTVQ